MNSNLDYKSVFKIEVCLVNVCIKIETESANL